MTTEKNDSLHEYYSASKRLPTHAAFSSRDQLSAYERQRASLFQEHLFIPLRTFRGARVVEFGPDSGENSLVFGLWGSSLTLVEPNPLAWPAISGYFDRFGLSGQMERMVKSDLQQFSPEGTYDIIDAEGFIYTIRPNKIWGDLFSRILADDGLAIISYYESSGSLFELFFKLIHSRARNIYNTEDSHVVARKIFGTKWESIGHTRKFSSWVMDVLENPFVRLEYFLDAASLCSMMQESGLSLYSSWPGYQDSARVYWHKRLPGKEVRQASSEAFLARNCLSYTFGCKLFISEESKLSVAAIAEDLRNLTKAIDRGIDDTCSSVLRKALELIDSLTRAMESVHLLTDAPDARAESIALLRMMATIIQLLVHDDLDGVCEFCNTDEHFIGAWGQPCHYAVFQKRNLNQ